MKFKILEIMKNKETINIEYILKLLGENINLDETIEFLLKVLEVQKNMF